MSRKNKLYFILTLLLLLGAYLRFHHLSDWSLSNDELSGLNRTSPDSFGEMLDFGVRSEGHPAGYHTFTYFWTRWVGDDTATFRLPFALAGLFSIGLLFLIGRKWFNDSVGLMAAATLATLQFPLLYSQLARPYGLGLAAVLLMVFAWSKIVFDRKKRFIPIYLIAAIACLYLHYFSFMLAGLLGFIGLFLLHKKDRWKYILIQVLIGLSFVPHLGIFADQVAQGGIGEWLDPPDNTFPLEHLFYVFNESILLSTVAIGALAFSIFKFREQISGRKFHWIALILFLTPILVGFFYSILRAPIVQHSMLLFSAPFLILLLFSFFPALSNRGNSIATAAIVLLVTFSTVWEKGYFQQPHFGEFEGVAEQLIYWENEYGQENIATFASLNHPSYLGYYFKKKERTFEREKDNFTPGSVGEFSKRIKELDSEGKARIAWLWSSCYAPPEVEHVIAKYYPHLERVQWFNSEALLFSKGEANYPKPTFHSSLQKDHSKDLWKKKPRLENAGDSSVSFERMDGEQEFSSTFEGDPKALLSPTSKNCTVKLSLDFRKDELANGALVLSFKKGEKTLGWHSANLSDFATADSIQSGTAVLARALTIDKKPDQIKAYVWRSNKKGWIDIQNMEISIFSMEKSLYVKGDFKRDYHTKK